MPRSDMIWTKSLELSLKLKYHLTQRTMISRSKYRPLNKSTAAGRLRIHRLSQEQRRFSVLHQNHLENELTVSTAERSNGSKDGSERDVPNVDHSDTWLSSRHR